MTSQVVAKLLLWGLVALVVVVAALGIISGLGSMPEVSDVSVRKGTSTAGVFFDLHNRGLLRDCVVDVEVLGESMTGETRLQAELHKTIMENNVMKMVKVDKFCVEPFGTVRARGAEGEGYHVMVFGDLEKLSSLHVHLKMESGKVIHFDAKLTEAEHGDSGHEH